MEFLKQPSSSIYTNILNNTTKSGREKSKVQKKNRVGFVKSILTFL